MPIVTYSTALAAGASVDVMQNSIYQILPWNAACEFAALASAAGLTWQVSTGPNILAEAGTPFGVVTAAGVFPKYPDEFHLTDVAGWNQRVKVLITNPTGGALTPFVVVRLTPL